MEDLSGNIRRVVEGLAVEIGRRVAASQGEALGALAEAEARQVLYDWFLGNFLPRGELEEAQAHIKALPAED